MLALVLAFSSFPPAQASGSQPVVTVLVANTDLPKGLRLHEPEKYFKRVRYFKGEEPRDAVVSFDQLKGKTLRRPLVEDQPMKLRDLRDPDLPLDLPAGTRAVAIKVQRNPENVAVLPGVFVDVVFTPGKSSEKREPKTVAQDVLVLAIDMGREDDHGTVTTVTLALRPDLAQRLALAAALGSLELVIRTPKDK
jgi:Flp pilus assembly protein CpaB